MTKTLLLALCFVVGSTAAFAAAPRELPRILEGADITQLPAPADPNLSVEASSDTFIFGPYDFETSLQGWTPIDLTENALTYGHIVDLTSVPGSRGNAFTGGGGFTGLVGWQGVLGANACGSKSCYPGYENGANQLLWKSFTIVSPTATISYKYRVDSELNYDYTRLIVLKNGVGCPTPVGAGYAIPGTTADHDTLKTYTNFLEGTETLPLSAYVGQTVCILFASTADAGYSDDDCFYDSQDGLFQIDDLDVAGNLTTFDSGLNGWTFGKTAGLGTVTTREPLSGLPNADPCPAYCGLAGNVVTMYDATDPTFHAVNQNEAIISPTLDLTTNPSYPVGNYLMQFDVYANMPLANGNFYFWHVRYQPVEIADCSCLDPTDWSPWLDENTIYYGGGTPSCGTGFLFNVSAKVPGHAQRLQMAIGVLNYPFYASTPGGNQSPYFDNVALRAAKISAPSVVAGPWDFLQDAYPNASSFASAKSTPAKIDNALNEYSPGRIHTRLGDTMSVNVALGCGPTGSPVEVDLLFKVTPGPCLNTSHPWWVAYTAQPKIASGPYAGFAVARMDTAFNGSNPNAATAGFGSFATMFHESAPAGGTTYAGLGNWAGYTGGAEALPIFPDDVFTPGSRLEWVVHTTYIPVKPNGDYYSPSTKYGNADGDRSGNLVGNQRWLSDGGTYDPSATFVHETMVLPLTTQDGNTGGCASAQAAHCFLYVDRTDGSSRQIAIENAFRNLRVTWDRYDVRAPTSAMGNDLGSRFDPTNYSPADHAPGPLPALLNEAYRAILWQTGSINSTNFTYGSVTTGSDAGNAVAMLDQWLRTTTDGKFLWLSGNGNARFLNATGTRLVFLNTTVGTSYVDAQYRDHNTVWGVSLTGVGGGCSTGLTYGLRGNWCPQRSSYNDVDRYAGPGAAGTTTVDFDYPMVAGTPYHAAVRLNAHAGGFNFDTQLDAFSLDQLVQNPPPTTNGPTQNYNVTNWTANALANCFTTTCLSGLTVVGVGGGSSVYENSLASPPRNPVTGGAARIDYSLKSAGRVAVRVYDVSGRLVATLVDGHEEAGPHSVSWATDGLKAGAYFYQVEAEGFRSAKKILLVQ